MISKQFRTRRKLGPTQWTHEDQDAALNQGWGVFDSDTQGIGGEGIQIQKYDEVDTFDSDEAANAFVDAQAEKGDDLCTRAITYVVMMKLHGG